MDEKVYYDLSVEELNARYLRDIGERHPHHVNVRATDIGACPRKVALRWAKAELRPESPLRTFERQRMFDQAHYQHDRLGEALDAMGVLIAAEVDVAQHLPEGLTGIPDYLVDMGEYLSMTHPVSQVEPGNAIWELKTPDPRVSDDNVPRHEDVLQLVTYHIALEEALDLKYQPRLCVARAGGKGPLDVFEIPVREFRAEAEERRDVLLEHRRRFLESGVIPDKQAPCVQYKGTTKIVYGPHWNCNVTWCPYAYWTCRPEEPEVVVLAERKRKSKNNPDPQMELTAAGKDRAAEVAACSEARALRLARKLRMTVKTRYDDWQMPNVVPPCDRGEELGSAKPEDLEIADQYALVED